MGMASSQARLLTLTARMHNIEYKAARIEAQKLQLANETRRVYEDYLNALDVTKIQYKSLNSDGSMTNNDATYLDLVTGKSGNYFALYTVDDENILLSEKMYKAYQDSSSANDFAEKMMGEGVYDPDSTPGTNPTGDDDIPGTNPGGTEEPGGTDTPGGTDAPVDPITPDEPDEPDEPEETQTYTLTRKGANSQSLSGIDSTGVTIKLTNAIDDNDLFYTITSNDGSPASGTVTYLDNGRLVIEGNNLKIIANENQKDNIMLFGSNNYIDTNSGNDIVRVGYVGDSLGGWRSKIKQYDQNIVKTGSGNDYVQNIGINQIETGAGTDALYDYGNWLNDNASYVSYLGLNMPSGVENPFSTVQTSPINNALGWGQQGGYGDCKFLSFLNSLNKPLSNFVSISKSGSNYKVNFKAVNTTITVQPSDMADSNNSTGDLDFVLTEIAFRKLISQNGFNMYDGNLTDSNSLGSSYNNFLISKFFFNQTKAGEDFLTESNFTWLLQQYKSGNISSLIVCSQQAAANGRPATGPENQSLGIYYNHAYAVKDGVVGKYVVLANPHDGKDEITLDWTDFFKYYSSTALFGDTYSKYVAKFGEPYYGSQEHSAFANSFSVDENIYAGDPRTNGLAGQYAYYVNLFYAIRAAKGVQTVPDEMIANKTYLSNIIGSGYAFLKVYDQKNDDWRDTSVATHTDLNEAADEILLKKAEAKYEADMKRIDLKERRYDTDLAAIETERNAIKQEMETLKTVTKDNVERTFKLFS